MILLAQRAHVKVHRGRLLVVVDDEQERNGLREHYVDGKVNPAAVTAIDRRDLLRQVVPHVNHRVHTHGKLPHERSTDKVMDILVPLHAIVAVPFEVHGHREHIAQGQVKRVQRKGSTVQSAKSRHNHVQAGSDDEATETHGHDQSNSPVESTKHDPLDNLLLQYGRVRQGKECVRVRINVQAVIVEYLKTSLHIIVDDQKGAILKDVQMILVVFFVI